MAALDLGATLMNKLALCQRLATEAEVSGASSGTLPSATTGQTGEMLQVVRDIENAYEELQNLRPNWLFMREDFSFNTVSGTAAYTPTAAGLTDFRAWRTDTLRAYLTATGVADEQWLEFVPWDRFRDSYMLADQRTTPGRPLRFTVKPDKSLQFWPVPDAIYTVVGEYQLRAQTLASNSSEPLMPDNFHMILVWMGMMNHARRQSAQELYFQAKEKYGPLMDALKRDQLPPVGIAGPMV